MMFEPFAIPRRAALRSLVCGSSLLLPGIVQQLLAQEGGDDVNPLAPKAPHFRAKAKRAIFMYMPGGVSHVDSFDPKPKLAEEIGDGKRKFLPAFWEFKRGGKCGTEVSDLFPHIRD
ncbi:MAG TPA: DUF1501 domain-containing protein, partial [Verrucomicrobiae bacterium]